MYESGIHVVAVQLQDVSPPKEVIGAFKDVASAKEDKNRMINQAEGYRNDVIPKARGEAEAMIRDAEGFRDSRIKRAEGDAAKFTTILKEYNKAKSITEKRLYLETMEKVLPDIVKIIVPYKDSGNMLNLFNLFPGTDGLLHISQIAEGRVETVEDHLKEGDPIQVKVNTIDDRGKIDLVRPELEGIVAPRSARPNRPSRGGRDSRNRGRR